MRKPLVALSLALCTGLGVLPAAEALAAPTSSSTSNFSTNSTPAAPSSSRHANSVSGAQIIATALKYLGYPYTATGNSPSTGFSCIGFVSYVYRQNGIPLPGDLQGALNFAPQVPFSQIEPGDILYFANTVWPGLSHAAIYLGNGRFVHAEYYGYGVRISSFNNDSKDGNYWTQHYMTANRPWGGAAVAPVVASTGNKATPPTTPSTTAVSGGTPATVTVASLNVRSGPAKSFGVITIVPKGTSLTITGSHGSWYKVQLPDGTVGWVVKMGVSTATATTASPPAQSTPVQPKRVGYPTASAHRPTVRSRVSGLRVHSSPSTGASVVTSLGKGQHVQVLARRGNWIKVRTADGSVGWILSTYASGSSSAATSSAKRISTSTASVAGPTVRSSVGGLRVHSTPSMSAPIVTSLAKGQRVQVIGHSGSWIKVRTSSGSVGWILSAYASGSASTATSSAKRVTTRTSAYHGGPTLTAGVRVHARPSLTSRVIGLAAAGTHVRVLGYSGRWAHVNLASGIRGYVYGSYVRS